MDSEYIRVKLLGALEVQRRDQDGTWVVVGREAWGKPKHARSVLKRLLTAPGRRLSRGQIQDDLWPEVEAALAETYLYNAVAKVRSAIGREMVSTHDSIYALADQATVWVDIDQVALLLREIENQDRLSTGAVALLEEALGYLERGAALEGEDGTWCYGIRQRAEDMLRQCRLWLAEAYDAQGKLWQAGQQYRALQQLVPDEEAALAWITMLQKHGKRQEAQKCFQQIKELWNTQGYALTSALEQAKNEPSLAALPTSLSFGTILKQDQSVTLRRFSQVLFKTTPTDTLTLPYLEIGTEQLWRNRQSAILSSRELYQPANLHLHHILSLLEGSLLSDERLRLCGMLSQTFQLIGELSLDMGQYAQGKASHQAALVAAQEAEDSFLTGISWARMSLADIYRKAFPDALTSIEQAEAGAAKHTTPMIQGWVAAIGAEVRANLAQPTRCFQSLGEAERYNGQISRPVEHYLVRFDRSLLGGYQGVCYRLLSQSDHAHASLFLAQARDALETAIACLDPLFFQRKPTLLTDLALVALRQQRIDEVCGLIQQAIEIASSMQLQKVLQRLVGMQNLLQPWQDASPVRSLLTHLAFLATQAPAAG